MAYNNAQKSTGSGNGTSFSTGKGPSVDSKTTAAPAGEKGDAVTLFTTGLFKAEKGAALATVRIKEDLVIPAGAYINLYEADNNKENGPMFRIQVRQLAPKA